MWLDPLRSCHPPACPTPPPPPGVSCNLEPLWRVVDFVCHLQTPPPAADLFKASAALGASVQPGHAGGAVSRKVGVVRQGAGVTVSTDAAAHYQRCPDVLALTSDQLLQLLANKSC